MADKFPLIIFLQGALVTSDKYAEFATELARYGFVVAVPNLNVTFTPFPGAPSATGEYADQREIGEVLSVVTQMDNNPSSPIYSIVDTSNVGLSGHSFGGAAALFTAAKCIFLAPGCVPLPFPLSPSIKAVAVYGAATPRTTMYMPVALIQGENDGKSLLANAVTAFNGYTGQPKALIVVKGENHDGICNDTVLPCGANADAAVQTINQNLSIKVDAKWAGLFFQAYLLDSGIAKMLLSSGHANEGQVDVTFIDTTTP